MIQLKYLAAPIGMAALALSYAAPSQASDAIETRVDNGGVQWSTQRSHGGATLKILGPDGFQQGTRANSVDGLRFSNFRKDGLYKYQITLEPRIKRVRPDDDTVARKSRGNPDNKISGSFRVVNGQPVDNGVQE